MFGSTVEIVSSDVVATIFLVAFIPICFVGAKIIRAALFVCGFVGAGYGTYLLLLELNSSLNLIVSSIVILVAALVGGILMLCLFKCAKFLLGFCVGLLLANLIYSIVVDYCQCGSDYIRIIVIAGMGFTVGIACACITNYVLEGLTAFVGSFMGISGVDHFVASYGNQEPHFDVKTFFTDATEFQNCQKCYIYFASWGVTFILGFIVQRKIKNWKTDESKERKEKRKEKRSKSRIKSKTKKQRGDPIAFVPVPARVITGASSATLSRDGKSELELIRLGIDVNVNNSPPHCYHPAQGTGSPAGGSFSQNNELDRTLSFSGRSETLDSSIGPVEYSWPSSETGGNASRRSKEGLYRPEPSSSASVRKSWESDPQAFASARGSTSGGGGGAYAV